MIFAVAYPTIYACFVIFEFVTGRLQNQKFMVVLAPVIFLFFIRTYVKIALRFQRGREADLIDNLQKLIQPPRFVTDPSSGKRVVSAPTPTQVFIRPRHELPVR